LKIRRSKNGLRQNSKIDANFGPPQAFNRFTRPLWYVGFFFSSFWLQRGVPWLAMIGTAAWHFVVQASEALGVDMCVAADLL
jgi:hypothetical protein